jgi:F0F1-type ATP synthase membrane subunit b/b'
MSQYPGPGSSGAGGLAGEPSTTDVARAQAADVGQHAREAGGQVAQTAADQARQVAAETSRQARDLLDEAQGHARDQASAQQQRAAQQLHSVAEELQAMAANSGQSGLATEVARQAAARMHGAASWLEQREPADLLEEVRDFARRRTGVFLIGAAVAGLAAGRLTRGLTANANRAPGPAPDTANSVPTVTTADGSMPSDIGGYPAGSAYAAEDEPASPAAPVYPAQPTFTPREGSGAGDQPTGGTTPPYPQPPYPADTAYPAESSYPADPVYPPEPGTAPLDEGEPR